MSRYKDKRHLIQWNTDDLMCLKMLAYCLRKHEAACRCKFVLWDRAKELCQTILKAVLNNEKTLEQIREETLVRTGIEITRDRLYQRSDKTQRYSEFNVYLNCVEAAYLGATHQPTVEVKPRRSFTDEQVRNAAELLNWRCYWRGCDLTLGVVGDHLIPWKFDNGPPIDANCVASCERCNSQRGALTAVQYRKLIEDERARSRKLHTEVV